MLLSLHLLVACTGKGVDSPSAELPLLTVDNAVLDSLGELAYDHFQAFEHDPEHFLAPVANVDLHPDQRETYLWILVNMAYAFQQHSQILQSAAYYEKALLYDNEHSILDRQDRLTYVYKPLANNYTVLSDYGKAERFLLQAFDEAEDPLDKASFSNNLVLLYTYKGDQEKAIYFGHLGLNYGQDSTHLCVLLHNSLSSTYTSAGQLDSARWHNTQAMRLGGVEMNEWTAAARISTLSQLGSFSEMDGAYGNARQVLLKALELENQFFPNSRHREKAALYNKLGEHELLQGEAKHAENLFRQGLSLYDQENLREYTSTYTKIDLLRNLGATFARSHPDSAWSYYRQAVEADFAYQQGVTTKESHLRNNLWNRKLLEEVYAFSRQVELDAEALRTLLWMTELTKGRLLWNDINRSAYWASGQTGMDEVLQKMQNLYAMRDRSDDAAAVAEIDRQLAVLQTSFELEEQYFMRNVRLPDFEDFQADLRQVEAICYSYFIHEDRTLSIFRNEGGRLTYWHRSGEGLIDSLAVFKERYFTGTPHHYNARPAAYYALAIFLQEILLPDLDTGKPDIQLSLDNELFTVPFDALYHKNQFLVADFNLHYIHSLVIRSLHPVRDFPARPIQVLYREHYDPPLADLHFVKAEVAALKRNFRTRLFAPDDLPSAFLKEVFDQGGIIHVAAHATIGEELAATLLLDQRISTDQLRYYTMQAPLVVLSACNTASGQLLLSEGLESINRAFLSKGVSGVVATHWFANDDTMLDLTSKFYHHLARTQRPVRALAEAKRQYLDEQSAAGRNPWYWANMAYTGADIKIDLPQRTGLYRLGIREFLFAIALHTLILT